MSKEEHNKEKPRDKEVVEIGAGAPHAVEVGAGAQALKKVSLFQTLSENSLRMLGKSVYRKVFEPGEVIIKQGEGGMGLFVIEQGRVAVSKEVAGQNLPLADLKAGDFFGELALINDAPRNATITATEETHCLLLVRHQFLTIVRTEPEITLSILRVLASRLIMMDEKFEQGSWKD